MSEVMIYRIPIGQFEGEVINVTLALDEPFVLTAAQWDQMIRTLEAMRPGLVSDGCEGS